MILSFFSASIDKESFMSVTVVDTNSTLFFEPGRLQFAPLAEYRDREGLEVMRGILKV